MTDKPNTEKLSPKERARLARRAAYQRAKAWRESDPRLAAMKEATKERRREAYQAAKGRRKAAEAERHSKQKATEVEDQASRRAAADKDLMMQMKFATGAQQP
jgi:hypothetical protein